MSAQPTNSDRRVLVWLTSRWQGWREALLVVKPATILGWHRTLFRLFWRFFTTLHPAPDAYPGLFAHYQRMMARPAVQKTIEIEASVGYQLPQ